MDQTISYINHLIKLILTNNYLTKKKKKKNYVGIYIKILNVQFFLHFGGEFIYVIINTFRLYRAIFISIIFI